MRSDKKSRGVSLCKQDKGCFQQMISRKNLIYFFLELASPVVKLLVYDGFLLRRKAE